MALCLVTGGAGFIGSHLVEALLARGDRVRVFDNLSTGSRANLASFAPRAQVILGDVLDLEFLHDTMRDVDVVYHQAALASVPRSIADPWATHQACATGTLCVLQAARLAKVRRVVYAASSSAYGASERLPKRESDPTLPLSPYAVAKLAGEQYCAAFSNVYGLETVRLRYFNVFGPRQPPDSPYAAVIPRFVQAMTAGKSPLIHGDGHQSRDFTHVSDVVQANLRAAEAPGVSGRVYNIACGRRTSLLQLVDQINAMLGTRIAPVHDAPRPGDVPHSLADISPAQKDLGYEPKMDVERGVRGYVEWFVSQTGKRKVVAA
ncbi:MAG: SDR family oxidoreductase [Gemmataceae bacterium]|nr:SDR family oxidoreductase [Gemmataceae bacterium]